MTSLWQYHNYNAPVRYLFDKTITEYDISKANISILLDAKKITPEEYVRLADADRMTRQYQIGCMIRDNKSLQTVLNDGFTNARQKLCQILGLEDQNILHIVKDAVFVVDNMNVCRPEVVNVSDVVQFTKRNTFANYLRLGRAVYYYHIYNIINETTAYKVRGIGEVGIQRHSQYFIQILNTILNARQLNGFKWAYDRCRESYQNLINRSISVEYARRFDAQSMFDLKTISEFSTFQAEYLSAEAETMVDPSFNLEILSFIGNCLLSDEMSRR